MGSLVAELAEKLSSATNSLDFDEQTLYINTSTNKVAIGTNAPVTDLTIEGPITIKEQADADADTAAYGQIWVNTATPNQLYFTTDAGNDIQLTTGTRLAATPADGAQTFNDTGADVDFRVESNNNANTFFIDGGTDRVGIGTTTPVTDLTVEGPITIKEQADADADTAAYGQIWVNTATPNQLYFTDDAGYDQKVSGGTAFRVHSHNSWVMG